ncbi:MAG TPA: PRTRC system protein B [Armatimonadota bacterium]|jgi:PRTRC genetic system protein B
MRVHPALSGTERLTLNAAVLLYRSDRQALATLHAVGVPAGESQPVIGPGRLLTRDALTDLVRQLDGLPQTRELLPANVLLADSGRLAWWLPSERRPIFFATDDRSMNRELSGRTVLHPALLFVAEPGSLCVFAMTRSDRPTAQTPLYRAPYFNLWTPPTGREGQMCAGNARLPRGLATSALDTWEQAFFLTNFSHTNVPYSTLTSHPHGHAGLWWYCAQERVREFPTRYLVPLNLTVGEVVSR